MCSACGRSKAKRTCIGEQGRRLCPVCCATLRSDVAVLHVDVAGQITLFNPKAPAVASGSVPGQRLLVSAGPGSITIQGISDYSHSGVVLAAPRRLAPGAWLSLDWTGSLWVETSFVQSP